MNDCDSILKVGDSCTLGCKEGYEFVEKMKRGPKRTHTLQAAPGCGFSPQNAVSTCNCDVFIVSVFCFCAGTGPAGLGARIKVPRHPACIQSADGEFTSELVMDVECVEEASLLGVFIIIVIMVLIPVRAVVSSSHPRYGRIASAAVSPPSPRNTLHPNNRVMRRAFAAALLTR